MVDVQSCPSSAWISEQLCIMLCVPWLLCNPLASSPVRSCPLHHYVLFCASRPHRLFLCCAANACVPSATSEHVPQLLSKPVCFMLSIWICLCICSPE